MFLTRNNLLFKAAGNQFVYKLKACSGSLCGLVGLQLIGAFFSLSGTAAMGTGNGSLNITLHSYSEVIIMLFSILWALIMGAVLTTVGQKQVSFTVPGNRLSDSLSDIALLLTGCVFGGVSTALLGCSLRIPAYFLHKGQLIAWGFRPDFLKMAQLALAAALLMLIFSASAYFAGVLVRLSKVFLALPPVIVIGLLYRMNFPRQMRTILIPVWNFYVNEHTFGFFALKIAVTAAVLFIAAAGIGNQLEVRK